GEPLDSLTTGRFLEGSSNNTVSFVPLTISSAVHTTVCPPRYPSAGQSGNQPREVRRRSPKAMRTPGGFRLVRVDHDRFRRFLDGFRDRAPRSPPRARFRPPPLHTSVWPAVGP